MLSMHEWGDSRDQTNMDIKTQLKFIHNDVVEWRARAWKGEVT